jgi:hypothetical protein
VYDLVLHECCLCSIKQPTYSRNIPRRTLFKQFEIRARSVKEPSGMTRSGRFEQEWRFARWQWWFIVFDHDKEPDFESAKVERVCIRSEHKVDEPVAGGVCDVQSLNTSLSPHYKDA